MIYLIVILTAVSAILLLILIFQEIEIKYITKQLRNIQESESNELIHAKNSGKNFRLLIVEINKKLKSSRKAKIKYQQKTHDSQQMMTNISHDLKTPLTSALGYINIIRSPEISDEEKEKEIQIIEQRLLRLDELINSFFEFSKIISGQEKPELKTINLVDVLQESMIHYYNDFTSQDREIYLNCDTNRINIESNKSMLMRIFDNLIANAYKHSVGNLTVNVVVDDGITLDFINITDDSELDTSRIFDEFYTTDISRTKGNTGLGLAIAKQFTEILGGSISASYIVDKFIITVKLEATPHKVC